MHGFADAHGQLCGVRAETHDAAVHGRAGHGLQLAVRSRYAVQSLGDVCGTLQQHVLENVNTNIKASLIGDITRAIPVDSYTFGPNCGPFSHLSMVQK